MGPLRRRIRDLGPAALALVLLALVGARPAAGAGVSIRLQIDATEATVNGEVLSLDVPPVLVGDRAMVPLRFVGEAMGASFEWDGTERRVTYQRYDTSVVLWIDHGGALVNGAPWQLDVPPILVDGRTMVPIRFVAEALGAIVTWEPGTRSIVVEDPRARRGLPPPPERPSDEDRFLPVGAVEELPGGLVFVSGRSGGNLELYWLRPGSAPLRLTDHPARDFAPALSPDGRWVAFVSDRSGSLDLWALALPESRPFSLPEVRPLVRSPADDMAPAWSPDGRWLAFSSDRLLGGRIYEVWAAPVTWGETGPEPGAARPVTSLEALEAAADPRAELPYQAIEPAWDPGGDRIWLVNYDLPAPPAEGEPPAGQPILNLALAAFADPDVPGAASFPVPASGDRRQPAWSPDGEWLAFAGRTEGRWEIWIMRADGSGLTRLTYQTGDALWPTWSPDGAWVAFASDRDGDFDLYAVEVATGIHVRLTDTEGAFDGHPVWGPLTPPSGES